MKDMNNDWLEEKMECAIREKGAIDHFKELEQKRTPWWRLRPVYYVSSFAVAASIALACSMPSYNRQAAAGYSYSLQALETPIVRGTELTPMLDKAVAQLNCGDVDSCLVSLSEVYSACDEFESSLANNDADVVKAAEISVIRDDADWYKAHALMREKKVWKAKALLRRISRSDSRYAESAREVLEMVF